MAFDNACQYLSETYPKEFATWILGETPTSVEILKTELSIEPIRADHVTFLRTTNQILHLEFEVEVEGEPPLPLRMLDYWVRLYRRYRLPVTQAIILLKPSPSATKLKDTFRLGDTRHRYQIIRIWQQDPEPLLQNSALLPLATLCRTETPSQLLTQVSQQLVKIETANERGMLTAVSSILAGLRFEKNLINQLFREDIMRESVIYQEILQKGLQQGLQQGLRSSILEALEERFTSVSPEVIQRLEGLTIEELKQLNRQAWTCESLAEFISQLPAENA